MVDKYENTAFEINGSQYEIDFKRSCSVETDYGRNSMRVEYSGARCE